MITQLKIENYKSIQELTLEIGRVNVLIGENGCGKSNILEAITLAAAAEADKLNNEFLPSRGIRVTNPELMRSMFDIQNVNKEIIVNIDLENINRKYIIQNDNVAYSKWIKKEDNHRLQIFKLDKQLKKIKEDKSYQYDSDKIESIELQLEVLKSEYLPIEDDILNNLDVLESFIIYSPENTSLRNLEKEGQIQPLGIYGEGLFKLLTVIQNEAEQSQDFSQLEDIQETLELFGWFEKITIPNNHSQLEQKLTIQDRFLATTFDQRSANEGFLLVLFYITLVVSKYTPKIFAIDNIDTSLNPKLCTKLIKELTRLAKKYDKQIFLTSHNPAILDGIDLGDEEQRLFVIYRDDDGRTCSDRIELKDKPKSSVKTRLARVFERDEFLKGKELLSKKEILDRLDDSPEPLKLSEAFLRGYLGGLPEGF